MNSCLPLFGVKLVVLFNFVEDGLGVIVGYVLVNDFDIVLREEVLILAVCLAFETTWLIKAGRPSSPTRTLSRISWWDC